MKSQYDAILSATRNNQEVTGPDRDLILNLLKQVPRYSTLASRPDVRLTRGMQRIARGRWVKMFFLNHVPVSKSVVFNTPKPSKLQSALRLAIEPQIKAYRTTIQFPIKCPLTGKVLTSFKGTHVDHKAPPFIRLTEMWMKENNLSEATIKLKGPPTAKRLANSKLEQSWIEFHLSHAVLQLCDAKANMRKGGYHYSSC